jgi:hypothetical protein
MSDRKLILLTLLVSSVGTAITIVFAIKGQALQAKIDKLSGPGSAVSRIGSFLGY